MTTVLSWLATAFNKLVQNAFLMVQDVVMWFWGMMWGGLDVIWDSLGLPQWPAASYFTQVWVTIAPYMWWANQWVPLVEGLTMLFWYLLFYALYVPVRMVLRHLPFVGG